MIKMKKIFKMIQKSALSYAIVLMTFGATLGQSGLNTIPRIIEKDGRHALLVDGEPYLMLGGQAHNSSAWPGMMPQV